jgi:crotonobetainyl-CoA:carnitine CoA-transferase CaiB-like acyl-CoA transferase
MALADLRVVEFTAGMAGPWIGRFMAHCGADVIKVESQRHPSVVRLYVPPREPELGTQPELSPWFTDWDAGKRFVALDLARPEGVELARRLAACADVVVENHSAGVMEKLGLGFGELRRRKADLVMLSTSGYGDSGPDRSFVTWGPNIEALSVHQPVAARGHGVFRRPRHDGDPRHGARAAQARQRVVHRCSARLLSLSRRRPLVRDCGDR